MKKTMCLLVAIVLLAGCASHYSRESFKTPSQRGSSRCWETANGSTTCLKDYESEVDGYGAGNPGMGYGSGYGSPVFDGSGRYLPAAPPVILAPPIPDTTSGERAMEGVPGVVTIVHPSALRLSEQTQEENLDALNKRMATAARKINKIERKLKEKK